MVDLGDYFSYNSDLSNVSLIFENLSRQLKVIHSHMMVVPKLSSKSISYDDGVQFETMIEPYNFELQKRENIVSFGKLMLGTYLSLGTGFKDFSFVEDEWFANNISDITKAITSDNFYPEYFEQLFLNGSNEYYCDFIDRKRQEEALNNRSNINGFKKVLNTAASSLYEEEESQEEFNDYQKNASISSIFYPLLIGGVLLVTLLIFVFIKINH